jgi:hypothetical protein
MDVELSASIVCVLLDQNHNLVFVDLTLHNNDSIYKVIDIFGKVVLFSNLSKFRLCQARLTQTIWYLNGEIREIRLMGIMHQLSNEQLTQLNGLLTGFHEILLHGFSYFLLNQIGNLYENNPNITALNIQLYQLELNVQFIRSDIMNILLNIKLLKFVLTDSITKTNYLDFKSTSTCIVRGRNFVSLNGMTQYPFRQIATLIDPCGLSTNFMGLLTGLDTISISNCFQMENYKLSRMLTYNPCLSALEIRLGRITKEAMFNLMHHNIYLRTLVLHDCNFGALDLVSIMNGTGVKYIAVIGIDANTKRLYSEMECHSTNLPRICFLDDNENITWIQEIVNNDGTVNFVDRAF